MKIDNSLHSPLRTGGVGDTTRKTPYPRGMFRVKYIFQIVHCGRRTGRWIRGQSIFPVGRSFGLHKCVWTRTTLFQLLCMTCATGFSSSSKRNSFRCCVRRWFSREKTVLKLFSTSNDAVFHWNRHVPRGAIKRRNSNDFMNDKVDRRQMVTARRRVMNLPGTHDRALFPLRCNSRFACLR